MDNSTCSNVTHSISFENLNPTIFLFLFVFIFAAEAASQSCQELTHGAEAAAWSDNT